MSSSHETSPGSEPRICQVYLDKEQIERFETNHVNGVLVLAVVEQYDYVTPEAAGGIFHYIADAEDHDRVIVREKAIAQHLRHLAKVSDNPAYSESRLEPAAQAYDFRGLGVSIPRDRIVDIDAPRISDENHSDQSSGQA